jgi:hypothetical protein
MTEQEDVVDGPQQLTSGSDTWQNNGFILARTAPKQYEYLSALVIKFHVKKHQKRAAKPSWL